MFLQLFMGSVLIIATAVFSAGSWLVLELTLLRTQNWVVRPPHAPKLVLVMSLVMLWAVFLMTVSTWLWAFAFLALGIFSTLEASLYFALVSFTTLGFGDILLPEKWRLLGGMVAANGLLIFGILTAMLIESVRLTRMGQRNRNNGTH
jgi:hypothetical protein